MSSNDSQNSGAQLDGAHPPDLPAALEDEAAVRGGVMGTVKFAVEVDLNRPGMVIVPAGVAPKPIIYSGDA